jgi:hypothetical protein
MEARLSKKRPVAAENDSLAVFVHIENLLLPAAVVAAVVTPDRLAAAAQLCLVPESDVRQLHLQAKVQPYEGANGGPNQSITKAHLQRVCQEAYCQEAYANKRGLIDANSFQYRSLPLPQCLLQ